MTSNTKIIIATRCVIFSSLFYSINRTYTAINYRNYMFLLLAFLYRIFHNLIYSNIKNPYSTIVTSTSILPLVALEYGQNAWASSAIFSAWSFSSPGKETSKTTPIW